MAGLRGKNLTLLSEAGLRINETLGLDWVSQEVQEQCAVIDRRTMRLVVLPDDSASMPDFLGARAQSQGCRVGSVQMGGGANSGLAGQMSAVEQGLRSLARNYRILGVHSDDPSHAPAVSARLNDLRKHPLSEIAEPMPRKKMWWTPR